MIGCAAFGIVAASAPKAVEVTIYNNDFGLVKELRSVRLSQGRQQIRIEDVPSAIDPSSVGIKSLSRSVPVEMLEQNYQYDLISPERILEKSVGKRVRFTQVLDSGNAAVVEGELLAAGNNVVRTDDGRIVLNPPGTVEVLEMPEGLISKPTLMWELEARNAGECDLELAYLTNAINWSADYVLTLNAADTIADLNGWVTINNRCGAAFSNAVLKLVAGDVRRIQDRNVPAPESAALYDKMETKKLGFAEQQLFEYHLYTLQRPASIRNNEIKQIALLSATGVNVKKQLIFEGQGGMWRSYGARYRPGEGYATDPNSKVNVMVELQNSEKNKLGMPLPKGRIRVYKRDNAGQVQMIGEDEIDHTPREEKIRLYVGDAFDLVGVRKRTAFRKISSRMVSETFEITLRNRKSSAETVRIIEHGWSEWTILNASQPWKKTDSNTFEFTQTLKPGEQKTLTYTIQTRW